MISNKIFYNSSCLSLLFSSHIEIIPKFLESNNKFPVHFKGLIGYKEELYGKRHLFYAVWFPTHHMVPPKHYHSKRIA